MPNPWEKYAAPAASTSGPWAKYGAPPPAGPAEPSAVPSGSDWLHAAGLPASISETDLTPKQALQLGAMNILHAADPTYLFRSVAVPMVKEAGRALKDPSGELAGVHAMAAFNPFAAPVINRMSELRAEGKEGEATATGIYGAGTLALGETLPRVAPAVSMLKKPLAAAADTLNPDLVGILSPRAAHILRTIGKVADALPDSASAKTHPATHAAVKDAFNELAKIHNVANVDPLQPTTNPPVNLLDNPTAAQPKSFSNLSDKEMASSLNDVITRLKNAETPASMEGYYGKTPTKSNLPANKRQLASPTGSTAPVPKTQPAPAPFSLGSMKNYYTGSLEDMTAPEVPAIRSEQGAAARAGTERMNPSPKGFGPKGQQGVEETAAGQRILAAGEQAAQEVFGKSYAKLDKTERASPRFFQRFTGVLSAMQ